MLIKLIEDKFRLPLIKRAKVKLLFIALYFLNDPIFMNVDLRWSLTFVRIIATHSRSLITD